MHGILPHSPLHARHLADIEYRVDQGQVTEHVLFVRETRVTAVLSHILIAFSLYLIPSPIDHIPIPVLDGLFLFCAFSTLTGKKQKN
jgi:sodium borate transporter 11